MYCNWLISRAAREAPYHSVLCRFVAESSSGGRSSAEIVVYHSVLCRFVAESSIPGCLGSSPPLYHSVLCRFVAESSVVRNYMVRVACITACSAALLQRGSPLVRAARLA